MVRCLIFISTILILSILFGSCDKVGGTNGIELQESEEAAVLDQFLTIPDQVNNYADPALPAFFNLLSIIEHYNSGVQNSPNLDNRLRSRNGNPIQMNLSNDEQAALVAFMKTLTDYELLTDEKFSNPFIN